MSNMSLSRRSKPITEHFLRILESDLDQAFGGNDVPGMVQDGLDVPAYAFAQDMFIRAVFPRPSGVVW